MTVIRVDAATFAQLKAGDGTVIVANESGDTVHLSRFPLYPLDQEPNYPPEEWERIMSSDVKYTTEQAIAELRKKR